jgi:cysteine-rich repeat protein
MRPGAAHTAHEHRARRWTRQRAGLGLALAAALVRAAAAVCGDGNLEPPKEACDDGNAIDHDGCSGQCQREEIAYQTWYESDDCTGKVLKRVVFNDREYLRSKDARIDFRFAPAPRSFRAVRNFGLASNRDVSGGEQEGASVSRRQASRQRNASATPSCRLAQTEPIHHNASARYMRACNACCCFQCRVKGDDLTRCCVDLTPLPPVCSLPDAPTSWPFLTSFTLCQHASNGPSE